MNRATLVFIFRAFAGLSCEIPLAVFCSHFIILFGLRALIWHARCFAVYFGRQYDHRCSASPCFVPNRLNYIYRQGHAEQLGFELFFFNNSFCKKITRSPPGVCSKYLNTPPAE